MIPDTASRLAALSAWIDEAEANRTRDPEARLWGRVAKISEEHGEVIAALIGATGQNPRKGVTHSIADVIDELLDVAVTALGAVEHLTGNCGQSVDRFEEKVWGVANRAGVIR